MVRGGSCHFSFGFLVFVPFTFGGIMAYEDFVQNACLWLLFGILFRLPHIAISEEFALASATKA
jgi:hypothetical protein